MDTGAVRILKNGRRNANGRVNVTPVSNAVRVGFSAQMRLNSSLVTVGSDEYGAGVTTSLCLGFVSV